jgi:hypothetical protein
MWIMAVAIPTMSHAPMVFMTAFLFACSLLGLYRLWRLPDAVLRILAGQIETHDHVESAAARRLSFGMQIDPSYCLMKECYPGS